MLKDAACGKKAPDYQFGVAQHALYRVMARTTTKGLQMEHSSHEFLKALLETPSPSGFEQQIQQVVRERMKPFTDELRTDSHGNVFAARVPEGAPGAPRIMLAGHCDQIGLMVQYIDSDGFLYIQPIGGW